MERLDLKWGGGLIDVFIDLRSGNLFAYSSEWADWIHHKYGGINYYRSRSGASGAGWIPKNITNRSVATYRVDTAYVDAPDFDQVRDIIPGVKIVAPFDYGRGNIPVEWPIVVKTRTRLFVLDVVGLWKLLTLGEEAEEYGESIFEDKKIVLKYIPSPEAVLTEREFAIRVHKGAQGLAYRRTLIAFHRDLQFQEPEGERKETCPFWARLGLRQIGNRFFKIAQNVCRARYTREELATVESLQAAAPRNVLVLSPNLYIQEGLGFEAVGLFQMEGEEVEFEEYIEASEAVMAMGGDYADIMAKLEAGARKKAERAREDRRLREQWAAEQAERDAKFRELCEQHPEVELTLEDSLEAGNCQPGTEEFRNKHFPSRDRVKVKELLRFINVFGVRRILEHKLLPLAS